MHLLMYLLLAVILRYCPYSATYSPGPETKEARE